MKRFWRLNQPTFHRQFSFASESINKVSISPATTSQTPKQTASIYSCILWLDDSHKTDNNAPNNYEMTASREYVHHRLKLTFSRYTTPLIDSSSFHRARQESLQVSGAFDDELPKRRISVSVLVSELQNVKKLPNL